MLVSKTAQVRYDLQNLGNFNFQIILLPNSWFYLGKTALHYAASNGKEKVGDILIKNGTDVNATNKRGQTALHVAAKKNRSNILNILIANGANADIVDDSGKTALHFAAQKG